MSVNGGMRRGVFVMFAALLVAAFAFPAKSRAGQLILDNRSNRPVVCLVDGYTVATGWAFDWVIQVAPGQRYQVGPNMQRSRPVIQWANCGGLITRSMTITPSGLDGRLVFNGRQTRVLNVLLYPWLPLPKDATFQPMVDHVVEAFQAANPEVLLNAVMSADGGADVYTFDNFDEHPVDPSAPQPQQPALLGPEGFDVIELDTVVLGHLATSGKVAPVRITGEVPFDAALQGSTVNGQLYGVPSWLCTEFVYARNPALAQVDTLDKLMAFLDGLPPGRPRLVGDHDGTWTLLARYIQAYVGRHGYGAIRGAFTMPPDPAVIRDMVAMVGTCAAGGSNACVDGTYHNGAPGAPQQAFAEGKADAAMGFSEQSLYITAAGVPANQLTAVPTPWGAQVPPPVLYSDAFVTSRRTCSAGPCAADSEAFTRLMTGVDMKTYIAFSRDLPPGTQPRRLLVATRPFWSQPAVRQDPLYPQFGRSLERARAYPNWFDAASRKTISRQVCSALLGAGLKYDCTPDTRPTRLETPPVGLAMEAPR